MKPSKYPTTRVPDLLFKHGIRYFEYGTLTDQDGNKVYDYYKVDKITPEQEATITQMIKGFKIVMASPAYAPEQKKAILCFPKAAYWRTNNG